MQGEGEGAHERESRTEQCAHERARAHARTSHREIQAVCEHAMEGVRNLWESQRGLMLLVGLSMVAISLVVVSGGLKGSGEDMTMTGDCWFVPSVEPTETYHLEIPDEEACGPCEFSSLKRSELERDEHGVPRWQLEVHCKSPSSRPRYRFSIINVVCWSAHLGLSGTLLVPVKPSSLSCLYVLMSYRTLNGTCITVPLCWCRAMPKRWR